jgi:SOS-response transcriptional repressor LexA
MGGSENVQVGPEVRGTVPLISAVQAGNYKMHVDNFHPGDGGEERISTTVPVKRHTFALRVSGDSMEPDFHEGAILIVEPEMEWQPGDYVIAKNGDGESTFKQIIRDGGDLYLKPLNPRYPIKPLGKAVIVGVVRAVERRFR